MQGSTPPEDMLWLRGDYPYGRPLPGEHTALKAYRSLRPTVNLHAPGYLIEQVENL